jgi:SAM-dependent methyltransferase
MRRSIAATVAELAVLARTLALRALAPFESALGAVSGARGALPSPPLWLRRHAGPLRGFRSSGEEAMALLDRMGLVRAGLRVLDFGCGPGSLVPLLADRIGDQGSYVGLDIHEPSIRWCRRAFSGDRRLRFERLDPNAAGPWPVAAEAWDLVLAKSVFTHLLEAEARAALAGIRRALAPGGRAVVTAFLFDGAAFAARPLPWFPCPDARAEVRWRRASRPTAAVAYARERLAAWAGGSGLEEERFVAGFHPGGAAPPAGQDTLVLRRSA